jgi:hypothetical protein
MRILIITFSYRPLNNPRAFRWTFLTEELIRQGHEVDVVTSQVPGELEVESVGALTVHRVGWKLIETLRARQRSRRAAMGSAVSDANGGKRSNSSLSGMILGLATSLWRALHWPDASCLWFGPARARALDLLARRNYDVVVSVAPSFTGVVVGRALKKRRPNLRWVLDLGDPFSFLEGAPPNNSYLYGRLNTRYERAAFADADEISVTNPQTRERYEAAFPESRGKIHVIPPLLTLPKLPKDICPVPGKLVYVGTLYRHIREPNYLLELFTRATRAGLPPQVELHFIGDISSCVDLIQPYQTRLAGRIILHGQVSREAVAVAMAEADTLINIGNDTTYQLPSKVVEYAASGKRILNFAKTLQDSSARFFAGYPLALNLIAAGDIPNEADVRRFVEFVTRPPEGASDFDADTWLAPYKPAQVVAEYLKLLGANHA